MSRVDRIVLSRLASRIGATVFVFFGIIALVESLDTWRFSYLTGQGGPGLAILAVAASAGLWTIKTLPVTVLMGGILGLLDLKARHEMTVIKATGVSIWRILRAPLVALVLVSLAVGILAEGAVAQIHRTLSPYPPDDVTLLTPAGETWLEQRGAGQRYVLMATDRNAEGTVLGGVTAFMTDSFDGERLTARSATLERGAWRLAEVSRFRPDIPVERLDELRLVTSTTPAELRLNFNSTGDLGFFELGRLLTQGIADPDIAAAVTTRFIRLLTLPLLLGGSLLIAFAFTAGYRRTNKYGTAILYGIVLGFVVFVITELADRAGASGALDPVFAALGPALVALVIGTTVLLYKEDGRI